MRCRSGENSKTHYRSDRFYCVDAQWYFSTRDQEAVGPFDTKEQAEQADKNMFEPPSSADQIGLIEPYDSIPYSSVDSSANK
jgi:Domain of unknown function (DUF6316)